MLRIFAYIYEKQCNRKIQKNLIYEYMFTGGKRACVYIAYLFHLLMASADEHVTVMNLLLISCLYGAYGGISYCRIVRDGSVLTDRSHRFPCSECALSRNVYNLECQFIWDL